MGKIITALFGWLFQTVVIKFVTFTAIYLVVSGFVGYLTSKLSSLGPDSLTSMFSTWTPEMWYFADLTLLTQGLPAVISAYLLRFAIRRMPLIG